MNPQLLLMNPVGMAAFLMKRLGPLEIWGKIDIHSGVKDTFEAFHSVPGT